jgi:cytochrome c oxidase subunit 4
MDEPEHVASDSHSHDAEHSETHGGIGIYIAVFVALCLLTLMSFLTYFPFWRERFPMEVGRSLMLAVACTKAALVIAFFMHLKWEKSWKYVLTIPTCMMAAFLVLMLIPDIGRRTHHYTEERWRQAALPAAETGHDAAHASEAKHDAGH